MHDLGRELLVGLVMVGLTVLMHIMGLMGLIQLTRLHIEKGRTPWLQVDRVLVPMVMVIGLFVVHGLEVWLYAGVYQLLGASRTLEEALYLSAGSYSTAGWTGEDAPHAWRVLFSLEAMNGILLLGWSTAFLFQNLHRILQTEQNHPLPEGAIAPDVDEDADDEAPDAPAEGQPEAADSGSRSPRPSRSGSGAPSGTNSNDTELMQ